MQDWVKYRDAWKPARVGLVALSAMVSTHASAGNFVDIKICNNYEDKVYVALAYPQSDGGWVSRGWLSVATGECSFFDTALHLPIFYYRGQTAWFSSGRRRRTREVWGGQGDRSFAVLESSDGSFNYYAAETREGGVPNEPFVRFFNGTQVTLDGDSKATVTFNADGTTSSDFTAVNPPTPAPPSPDNQTGK